MNVRPRCDSQPDIDVGPIQGAGRGFIMPGRRNRLRGACVFGGRADFDHTECRCVLDPAWRCLRAGSLPFRLNSAAGEKTERQSEAQAVNSPNRH